MENESSIPETQPLLTIPRPVFGGETREYTALSLTSADLWEMLGMIDTCVDAVISVGVKLGEEASPALSERFWRLVGMQQQFQQEICRRAGPLMAA